MGLQTRDLNLLRLDGCQLVNPVGLFEALLIATSNDPCETGCAYFDKGNCPAYLKHHSTPLTKIASAKTDYARSPTDQSGLIGGKWADMTIRQIAAKESISLGEARRRKQAGNYQS